MKSKTYALLDGQTAWIQSVNNRQLAVVVCPAQDFEAPDITYCKTREQAESILLEVLENDLCDMTP